MHQASREIRLAKPTLGASVADTAPVGEIITDYDRTHLPTYLRLLDAAADKADPNEVARIVLGIDPTAEPERARRAYETHLARARWISTVGYRQLASDSKRG
jgi:hypothetical protein